ncbi:phage Gp37/Gp68 family protein [Burkholderia stagnalis]|uniref:phage Gp37/Gp68 family protein n=1 Tax=Burkholderia stagnalis TaxID=1503054 RepID=UPI000F58BD0E|nr:phage Gp37/Gp68 family protein [Burkholderia stagnalis]RQR11316.1 phage Gp37/Gp68 family protein [Burkholderia stagnalis]RQR20343.1 phage Gp37/Gp68 family protein [Burkholderia stagnalis]
MSENSKIEWTDHTFNPFIGCTKVSPGCDNCYAEHLMDKRMHKVVWGPHGERVRTAASTWRQPIRWNAAHAEFFVAHGRRQRVFCASLADVFDNAVPDAWRADLFDLIWNTPNLDWLLLTKRIGNVAPMLREIGVDRLPDNVWLGATIVNQQEADRDIPKLLMTPARVRFLSMEPLLGPVDLTRITIDQQLTPTVPGRINALSTDDEDLYFQTPHALDWVIVGGESGPGARPMHPNWARSLRDQCAVAAVPFLFKQWGEWHTDAFSLGTGEPVFRQFGSFQQWVNKAQTWVRGGICLDRHGRELRNGGDFMRARDSDDFPVTIMHRTGKKAAGRLLDGRTHDDFPVEVVA